MVASNNSAGAYISLLNEQEPQLQYYGLVKLNEIIEQFWAEISDHVEKIEAIAENTTDDHHKLAALVASKIYFHLQEFNESLNLALEAGDFFNLKEDSSYIKTVVNKGIQEYISIRQKNTENFPNSKFEKRLEYLAEGVFDRCITRGEYSNVVGLSIESRRLDILEKVLKADNSGGLFQYVLKQCLEFVNQIDYRNEIYKLLVKVQLDSPKIDYASVCYILAGLDDPSLSSNVLIKLALSSEDGELSAYQIAFDTEETVSMEYLALQKNKINEKCLTLDTESDASQIKTLTTLSNILDGSVKRKLLLDFYFSNNRALMSVLNKTNSSLDSRSSIYHSAMSISNAYMHAGTTVDSFLRNNLDWLSRASNWSKFTATAALGVIHRGQSKFGMNLMKPYLPQDGVSSSPYSESGAFFGLGLIHSCSGTIDIIDYLHQALSQYQTKDTEILQHGASLGLGLAALGLCRADLYESLKTVLYTDSAIAGEAAGIGMGLLMFGSGNESVIDDMLQYARETHHEKIIRGLAIGMALVVFGIRDDAEVLINDLCNDEDPLLRYAGILATTTAYCNSGSNDAIQRLLHTAVSDVNDDVRRASVIGLGFLLLSNPAQVPRMVELLSGSYNPHVRFGAALSLGIALAGSGSADATKILEPMLKDSTDFVRQGAFISMAMVLMQQNDHTNPKVTSFRETLTTSISNKHEEPLSKIGAVMGQGIIDACGQNATIQLISKSSGLMNTESCIGIFLMTQFWSWFPLSHFLSLAFTPTAIIAVNKDMKVPKLDLNYYGKPNNFEYHSTIVETVTEKKEAFVPVALSFTNKSKSQKATQSNPTNESGRSESKESASGTTDSMMETDNLTPASDAMETDDISSPSKNNSLQVKSKRTRPTTTSVHSLSNFGRILPQQEQFASWNSESRFVPVKPNTVSGFIVVKDKSPSSPAEFISTSLPEEPEMKEKAEESNLVPPEPFQYPFGRD